MYTKKRRKYTSIRERLAQENKTFIDRYNDALDYELGITPEDIERDISAMEKVMALRYLENIRWKHHIFNPIVEGAGYTIVKGLPYYKCTSSQRNFSVLTNTHLEGEMKRIGKWITFVEFLCLEKDIWTIKDFLGISDRLRLSMYQKVYFAFKIPFPSDMPEIHTSLIKALKKIKKLNQKAIFKQLLTFKRAPVPDLCKVERSKGSWDVLAEFLDVWGGIPYYHHTPDKDSCSPDTQCTPDTPSET